MNASLGWGEIASIVGIAAAVCTVAMIVIRDSLRREFVTQATHEGLADVMKDNGRRLHDVEVKMGAVPTHEDMREVFRRIAAVEAGVTGVQSSVSGIERHLGKLAHDIGLLLDKGLNHQGDA